MDSVPGTSEPSPPASPDVSLSRGRLTRARKRRYISSDSSSDVDAVLPENILEVEKNLHASAVKNNLDDVSVKKILKKVVTNDHVLALVKLREEEENKAMEQENMQPKLTRAKVKELMKVSPKTAWNLENMALTPIKHIPVRTRPEVTALIAQELPEDEDDDEYEPTYDDVPSDDDHTLESCSDVDSQPRTPATPRTVSPRVRAVKDGPFKVPQNVTPRRKLDMDEDATIALRTRSKLSLSSIPIDHIESSFVPPDEAPMPAVDDVWTEFLQECLNPETEEVDDDDDPEYNVAADPDSHDEDEEGLENIIKISKKELNDLVTELFNVMPDGLGEEVLSGKLANGVPQSNGNMTTRWEGKQEVISDDEDHGTNTDVAQPRKERALSIGKIQPVSDSECQKESEKEKQKNNKTTPSQPNEVRLSVVEGSVGAIPPSLNMSAPAPLKNLLTTQATLTVEVQQGAKVLPEQILILEQQLRQHIQLATSNFLQLFVHPVHWALAPIYKEYLETLTKMTNENPNSVANVCNLKLAMEMVTNWEKSVSADTKENVEMVEFIHKEVERSRRRAAQNSLYVGDFHERFISTVANSPVFLYPHLLPPLPYRSDGNKRFGYTQSEDELITLGIDEFWQYVEDNPDLYKVRATEAGHRWGLGIVVSLLCKHMLPWMQPRSVLAHIQLIRKKDPESPIYKFFKNREVTPVKHVLLPFNPELTLYQQPEQELPRRWVKYLAKNSRRFRGHLFRRSGLNKVSGLAPAGVPVDLGAAVQPPSKPPLPSDFMDPPNRTKPLKIAPKPPADKFDLELTAPATTTPENTNVLYSVIQTPAGAYLIPLTMLTNTVDTASAPVSSSQIQETVSNDMPEQAVTNFTVTVPAPITKDTMNVKDGILMISNNQKDTPIYAPVVTFDHCQCCIKLRKITSRQSLITEYFKEPKVKSCPCKEKRKVKYPRVTRKFKLLLENYKCKSGYAWKKLKERIAELDNSEPADKTTVKYSAEEIATVAAFQLKLTIRTMHSKYNYMKKKVCNILSRYDPDVVCPMKIMKELLNAMTEDCEDMYKEFFGFMTKEQADKMGKYRDYFKQVHLRDLMQKIEEHVPRKEIKQHILIRLSRTLADRELSPCDVCAKILDTVVKYPKLAEYVFSLFPHRRSAAQFANKAVVEMPKDVTTHTEAMQKAKLQAQAKDNVNDTQNATANQPITDQIDTDNIQNTTQVTSDPIETPSTGTLDTDNIQNTTQLTTDPIEIPSTDTLDTDNLQNKTQLTTDPIEKPSTGTLDTDNIQNTTQLTTDTIEKPSTGTLDTDNIHNTTQPITNRIEEMSIDTSATDDIQNITADQPNEPTTDNVEEASVLNETQQTMDYEADHSASDDDGSADNLTIVEEPDGMNQRRASIIKNENTESENAMDTSVPPVTKTEIPDYSESDMSTMIMSEDEIVKKEPAEWNRDEDKQVLKVLQQSLTPEEMKDKTILEIIEQKKVLQLAAENLPEKTLDDVRERMLYLLEFLVNQQ